MYVRLSLAGILPERERLTERASRYRPNGREGRLLTESLTLPRKSLDSLSPVVESRCLLAAS